VADRIPSAGALEIIDPARNGGKVVTAASCRRLIACLLRAGFLAAGLAIIAGIFGMHMMTGTHRVAAAHTLPVAGAGHATAQMSAGTAGHSGHVTHAVKGSSSSYSSAGSCPEMSATGTGCVFSPGNTSLSAALPGIAPYALPDFDGAAAAGTTYSYSPDSPSPGDLCISRT